MRLSKNAAVSLEGDRNLLLNCWPYLMRAKTDYTQPDEGCQAPVRYFLACICHGLVWYSGPTRTRQNRLFPIWIRYRPGSIRRSVLSTRRRFTATPPCAMSRRASDVEATIPASFRIAQRYCGSEA